MLKSLLMIIVLGCPWFLLARLNDDTAEETLETFENNVEAEPVKQSPDNEDKKDDNTIRKCSYQYKGNNYLVLSLLTENPQNGFQSDFSCMYCSGNMILRSHNGQDCISNPYLKQEAAYMHM